MTLPNNEKFVIIGAGSAMFTRGMIADLIARRVPLELALVDVDPHALAVAEGLAKKMIAARKAPIRLSSSTDRRDVLRGATAVICTIGVGGRDAWHRDVTIPRKYGIYQPVGDTAMPGGTSRALRMIPAMVAIAEDVLDLAPSALFFNYGNPMATVCRGVRKATGADMIGLCHGVHYVAEYLAKTLGVGREQLRYSAVGINHLTWFTELRVDGEDAMPRLRALAAERAALQVRREGLAEHFDEAGTAREEDDPAREHPFSWRLTHLFGAFPAVMDRHVVEFFPQLFKNGEYFGKKLGVEAFSLEQVLEWGQRIFDQMAEEAFSPEPLKEDYFKAFSGEHEQVVDIIDSIRNDAGRVYSANVPNAGQVPNLPSEVVIECPSVADGTGLRPLVQRPLTPALLGTLATRFAWVETVVDAALEGSREKFIQALILDGCVSSLADAERLADELLEAHAEHLPQFAELLEGEPAAL